MPRPSNSGRRGCGGAGAWRDDLVHPLQPPGACDQEHAACTGAVEHVVEQAPRRRSVRCAVGSSSTSTGASASSAQVTTIRALTARQLAPCSPRVSQPSGSGARSPDPGLAERRLDVRPRLPRADAHVLADARGEVRVLAGHRDRAADVGLLGCAGPRPAACAAALGSRKRRANSPRSSCGPAADERTRWSSRSVRPSARAAHLGVARRRPRARRRAALEPDGNVGITDPGSRPVRSNAPARGGGACQPRAAPARRTA